MRETYAEFGSEFSVGYDFGKTSCDLSCDPVIEFIG